MQAFQYIVLNTSIDAEKVKATLTLLKQDCTIPFIARYRKDITGNLDEVEILAIKQGLESFEKIEKRKASVLIQIQALNTNNEDVLEAIKSSFDLKEIERLFDPFKVSKNKTLDLAKAAGFEKLAKILMSRSSMNPDQLFTKYISKEFKTTEDVRKGVEVIISDFISQQSHTFVFDNSQKHGLWKTKVKKDITRELELKFKTYLEFEKAIRFISSHQFLGIERAVEEGAISRKLSMDETYVLDKLNVRYLKEGLEQSDFVEKTIKSTF